MMRKESHTQFSLQGMEIACKLVTLTLALASCGAKCGSYISREVRVQASDVVFIETNDTIVRFLFPREQAIQAGDKEVIFRFEMSDSLV